jgi:hypothetical protein
VNLTLKKSDGPPLAFLLTSHRTISQRSGEIGL